MDVATLFILFMDLSIGIVEYLNNLKVAKMIRDELKEYIKVKMQRQESKYVEIF